MGMLFPPLIWQNISLIAARCEHFEKIMKIKNSIKSLRKRHRDNRVVRRRGRLYVINKTIKRYKARQG